MKTIILTRQVEQNVKLIRALAEISANLINLPLIQIEACEYQEQEGENYDWVVFTSANGVKYYRGDTGDIKIAAVGGSTSIAVKEFFGRNVDLVSSKPNARALATELLAQQPKQVLVIQGDKARLELTEILKSNAVQYDTLTVYQNKPVQIDAKQQSQILHLEPSNVYWIFYSPSAFESALKNFKGYEYFLKQTKIISIGPTTSKFIKLQGYAVFQEVKTPSIDSVKELFIGLGDSI